MSDDIEIDDRVCTHCGNGETRTQPCFDCEDGFFDGYEEDPLWYHPGEWVRCSNCNGRGFFHWCPKCDKTQPTATA